MEELKEKEVPEELKKKHSYTYWVNEHTKSRELPPEQQPVKLEKPISIVSSGNYMGRSDWNQSGTWYYRKISMKYLTDKYRELVCDWIKGNKFPLGVKNIELTGECHRIFMRNKRTVTYELKGSVEFEGEEKNCKIVFEELTDHCDEEYIVQTESVYERKLLQSTAKEFVAMLQSLLQKYKY